MPKGTHTVQDYVSPYRKGSLIPSILSVESDLIERERNVREDSERIVDEARQDAYKLIRKTKKELPRVEEKERQELIAALTTSAENLLLDRERELLELRERIARNRKQALNHIIAHIIPGWKNRDTKNS